MNDMRSVKVTIPALPIGNAAAVANMVRMCGGEAIITANPQDLLHARRVILAGVGAFDAGMCALERGGWLEYVHKIAQEGEVAILGICLGMQLMCRSSEEGVLPGLGWFDAVVKRIQPPPTLGLKVPHMGWNTIRILNPHATLAKTHDEQRFYFVHSYHVVCDNPSDAVATVSYGGDLIASIARNRLIGVQFHPEKSHRFGTEFMKRFLAL